MNPETRKRLPRHYDGTLLTTRHIQQILPSLLNAIGRKFSDRPDLILRAWPDVVGPKLAPMTHALSFVDGILTVTVKNSTLYSLLAHNDKPRLIKNLRDKFPGTVIKTIFFRLG